MISKTPQFDKAMDAILNDLKPRKKICKNCKTEFEIFSEDTEMYHKFRVPPPTFCSLCRMQRRLSNYLRIPPFYRKPCTAPGHRETVITLFPPGHPIQAFDNQYWRSDAWDELEYGRLYDFGKSFFEQYKNLFYAIPHQALFVDPQSVNSEYAIGGVGAKNCYYAAGVMRSENIMYAWFPSLSKDSADVANIEKSELLYECINAEESYNCNFSMDIMKCRESWFLYDCRNCSNCFMSSNLRNKSYYFYNRQLSKEDYEQRIGALKLEKRISIEQCKNGFKKMFEKAIHRAVWTQNAVNSIGDKVFDCKNCFQVFEIHENSENIRYVIYALGVKDMLDVSGVDKSEFAYESTGMGSSSHILFSGNIRNSTFLEYSEYCRDSHYCFGSVGLKGKRFCIFNKQYAEDEYWATVDAIKTSMLKNNEYGEFFPVGLMPYQNTLAQVQFPLTKDEASASGIPWYEEEQSFHHIDMVKAADMPETISEVKNAMLDKAILCDSGKKYFRIVKPELEFYRTKNLPLPTEHPDDRIRRRFDTVNKFRLYESVCAKCGKEIVTSFDPARKLTLYCEECYLKEFQ